MISLAALAVGTVIALWFAVWAWRVLGAVASAETLVVGVVVVVAVAMLYGLLPPLFGFAATSASVVVAGCLSLVLLRLLF